MSELDPILAELKRLSDRMDEILCAITNPQPAALQIVGVDYVAEAMGLAVRTVQNKGGGLKRLTLARGRPLGWYRHEVDQHVRDTQKRKARGKRTFMQRLVKRKRKAA